MYVPVNIVRWYRYQIGYITAPCSNFSVVLGCPGYGELRKHCFTGVTRSELKVTLTRNYPYNEDYFFPSQVIVYLFFK